MATNGKVRHNDAICSVPISEHNGNEACLVWETPPEPEVIPVARYTQGPQGNQITDYRAEYEDRMKLHGHKLTKGPLGHADISDRRDTRDPMDVYRELHPHEHTFSGNGKVEVAPGVFGTPPDA